jgi:DNA-binding transcriptional regulator YiaG
VNLEKTLEKPLDMNNVHVYIEAMKNWNQEEIKEFRKRLDLYQKDFAQKIGVTMRYVIYLEQGVRQPSKTLKILLTILEEQENEKGKVNNHGKGGL